MCRTPGHLTAKSATKRSVLVRLQGIALEFRMRIAALPACQEQAHEIQIGFHRVWMLFALETLQGLTHGASAS